MHSRALCTCRCSVYIGDFSFHKIISRTCMIYLPARKHNNMNITFPKAQICRNYVHIKRSWTKPFRINLSSSCKFQWLVCIAHASSSGKHGLLPRFFLSSSLTPQYMHCIQKHLYKHNVRPKNYLLLCRYRQYIFT